MKIPLPQASIITDENHILRAKDNLGRSRKGLITSMGTKARARPNKHKKARYAIGNVSMKDLSKIIQDFEKLPYNGYERKRPNNDPSDSYFYPTR